MNMKQLSPQEIELLSFEIIERELGRELDPVLKPIIKRVIHTTADFSYVDTLTFSEHAVEKAIEAFKKWSIHCYRYEYGKGRELIKINYPN